MTACRQYLRAATAAAHHALEAHIGSLGSIDAYRRYLRIMFAFRSAVEDYLTGFPCDAVVPLTLLSNDIRRDCADLGVTGLVSGQRLQLPHTSHSHFGVIYVLEGSALGARLLHRDVAKLGFNSEFGARHLARQVKGAANWPRFLARLESEPCLDMTLVSAAAKKTFALATSIAETLSYAEAR